ncbi:MAG: carbon starvation protein A [Candidatus Eisenbacteria bacterium]|uniref:Carbon starvation protein A n=1 Tax=Eiseniibacteriota bacterium TaxID=2212470 RepID=A0A538SU66_UNCEI|nr:MAG: carbon starvation protein A [Candidatus Eisenbacteria bacterium]
MNSLVLPLTAIVLFSFAYRYYAAFIANKVARVDPSRPTPATTMADGRDYVKTNKYVLFGHHFAAISASGPLIGPVLAAQFGYLPGALWILIGAALAGAVHDFIILFASVRHGAAPLSEIARREIGPVAHGAATAAILFITVLLLAGLAIVVVNALANSPWGTFTVAMTIPAALLFGFYMYRIRPGRVVEGSLIGVALILAAVIAGPWLLKSQFVSWFTLQPKTLGLLLPVYGFIAATLPVWLLLCPRDYLSTYMKIGTIVLLVLGVAIVHPKLLMPAVTPFINGTGPVLPGMKVFPFCFIVIACGAISGFHSLIGSGTTPRMVPDEGSIKFIAYGAMLTEGVVAIMALVAATTLHPADYFLINGVPKVVQALGIQPAQLHELTRLVGEETLQGRTGGAVSLAVGMANILRQIPGMGHLMAYWYHFAIMFEAVFILTALDTGTRVARYLFQDVARNVWAPLGSTTNWLSVSLVGAVVCVAWGYLAVTGSVETIWPLFGVSNQLLAVIALAVGTSFILRQRPAPYALVTLVPLAFLTVSTMTAGVLNTLRYLSPAYVADKGATVAYIDGALSVILILLVGTVLIDSVRRWAFILAERRRGVVNVPAAVKASDGAGA